MKSGSLDLNQRSDVLAVDQREPGAHRENAELAKRLIAETIRKQEAVRGAALVGRVTRTHSRPYTSNGNPFSESQFKTLKYRPEFPERFVRTQPEPPTLPTAVWINPPATLSNAPELLTN